MLGVALCVHWAHYWWWCDSHFSSLFINTIMSMFPLPQLLSLSLSLALSLSVLYSCHIGDENQLKVLRQFHAHHDSALLYWEYLRREGGRKRTESTQLKFYFPWKITEDNATRNWTFSSFSLIHSASILSLSLSPSHFLSLSLSLPTTLQSIHLYFLFLDCSRKI